MGRYIDADALKYYGNHIGDEYEDYFHETQWVYRSQIDTAPSIDIVRCKECKFNYGNEHNCSFNPNDIVCTYWESDGLQSDDFCSYGEREGE